MTKPKERRRTADELIDELAKDSDYIARARERDEKLCLEEERLTRAEEPLTRELREAGANTDSAWDLRITKQTAQQFIPILLKHLDRPYPIRVREGIARALAVPAARPWWYQLVDSYRAENGPVNPGLGVNEVKWAIHLAIAAAADASVLDELIRLAADRRHGAHRQFFVDALASIDNPRAHATLKVLEDDPALADAFQRVVKRRKRRRRR